MKIAVIGDTILILKNLFAPKRLSVFLVPVFLLPAFFSWRGIADYFKPKNETAVAGVVNRVITDKKVIALTFDVDMTRTMFYQLQTHKVSGWYNGEVIKILESENVPATLFLTGLWVKAYPDITGELSKNQLFEIANHSYSHRGFVGHCYNLAVVPARLNREEITKVDGLLAKNAHEFKKYFRFPGLCHDQNELKLASELGYTVIGGTPSGDAFAKDPKRIIDSVVRQARPGAIIIFHMQGGYGAPQTQNALPGIIKILRGRGYKFLKISDLLKLNAPRRIIKRRL